MTSINSLEALEHSRLSTLSGSCSTIALSDIDSSSLTHVSLDEVDGNSTVSPASSTLSLCWDTDGTPNPTPAATPARSCPQPRGSMTPSGGEVGAQSDRNSDYNASYSSGNSDVDSVSLENGTAAVHDSQRMDRNHANFTPTAQIQSISDSCPSSASLTPNLTPSLIPPMKPIDTVYIPNRSSDSNNNKPSVFQFPEMSKTQSHLHNTSTQKPIQRDHPVAIHPASDPSTAAVTSYGSNNRRRSSPVISHRGRDFQAQETSANDDAWGKRPEQRDRRRSGGNDVLSPADSGFGSPSACNQPRMAVQPFQHTLPSMPTSSAHSTQSSPANISADQHQPTSKSVPFIKPQLLREARLDSSKVPTNQTQRFNPNERGVRKPLNTFDASQGSRHSSQESLSSQQSCGSNSHLVPKPCRTDLSQPSMRPGTSSESLHSNSSAGRSDSYRVALLAEADQISFIQDKNQGLPGRTRNIRTGSLVEKSFSNNNMKNGIDRSQSSSLSSNPAHPTSTSSSSSFSHRPHLSKSMSTPAPTNNKMNQKNSFPQNHIKNNFHMKGGSSKEEDPVSRADSYRCAMHSSQSAFLQGDIVGRNSSYRLATHDEDDDGIVVNLGSGNNRMDACNMWTGKSGASRDVRRMGITDVDQLKSIPTSGGNGARSVTNTQHARKKFGVRPDGNGAGAVGDPKKMIRLGSGSGVAGVTLRDKSNKQQKLHSSSYIRFDPIFESGEDLRASKESLRPPSIVSVRTLARAGSKETLVSDAGSTKSQGDGHRGASSPARRRSGSQGRHGSGVEDGSRNGSLSIFGSIKTTIKSIGSGKAE